MPWRWLRGLPGKFLCLRTNLLLLGIWGMKTSSGQVEVHWVKVFFIIPESHWHWRRIEAPFISNTVAPETKFNLEIVNQNHNVNGMKSCPTWFSPWWRLGDSLAHQARRSRGLDGWGRHRLQSRPRKSGMGSLPWRSSHDQGLRSQCARSPPSANIADRTWHGRRKWINTWAHCRGARSLPRRTAKKTTWISCADNLTFS